jgi:hypothetical protein
MIFVYSGGYNNTLPDKSIGGIDSVYIVPTGGLNNLFRNISKLTEKKTDYKCVYAVNNSNKTYENCEIYLTNTAGGSDALLGIATFNDKQRIMVSGNVTGGSLSFNYVDNSGEDNNFSVQYDSDIVEWANNFQTALNGLGTEFTLSGVVVTGVTSASNKIFTIEFAGNDGFRKHSLISITDNSLTGTNSVVIQNIQTGRPINAAAVEPGVETNYPAGVDFDEPSSENPLGKVVIGILYPNDIFAIWVKRSTKVEDVNGIEDGAKIIVRAEEVIVPE